MVFAHAIISATSSGDMYPLAIGILYHGQPVRCSFAMGRKGSLLGRRKNRPSEEGQLLRRYCDRLKRRRVFKLGRHDLTGNKRPFPTVLVSGRVDAAAGL